MVEPQRIKPVWAGERCIVAASGPSLTPDVIRRVRLARWLDDWRIIVVNDAYKAIQHADVLYAVDNRWWEVHGDCKEFTGQKWAAHEQDPNPSEIHGNDKRQLAEALGLNLIRGVDRHEFSFDQSVIAYGNNAGFQAVNLAILFGCTQIVLVGFDMRKGHFFGEHPRQLRESSDEVYAGFAKIFEQASKKLPSHIRIVNATPGSAMKCFPMMSLDDALRTVPRQDHSVSSHGSELQQAAG